MRLYVDGDSCPVKAEIERVGARHGVRMVIVTNGGLRPSANPLIETVFVAQGLDEADRWIAERAGPGDVVVTADIPLAASCIEKGAVVVQHDGSLLDANNIGPVLARRDLMSELRAADPFHRGSGRSFTKADRAGFLNGLERVLRRKAPQK